MCNCDCRHEGEGREIEIESEQIDATISKIKKNRPFARIPHSLNQRSGNRENKGNIKDDATGIEKTA